LSRLYLKSVQTRRTALSPYTKVSFVLYTTILTPVLVLPAAAAHPPSSFDPKLLIGNTWEYSSNLTGVYLDILHEIATSGTTFKDKNALLTGVGKGSIGVEIVKGLLSGGAHVVITTPSYSHKIVEYYQSIFQFFGSRGAL
jgi:3-oxoacyl-ACP reductase-like protein